jgi:hypothetical protein
MKPKSLEMKTRVSMSRKTQAPAPAAAGAAADVSETRRRQLETALCEIACFDLGFSPHPRFTAACAERLINDWHDALAADIA